MYGAAQEGGDQHPLINIYLLHVEDAPAQGQGTGEHHHRLLMANMLGMDMGMPGGQQPHDLADLERDVGTPLTQEFGSETVCLPE